MSTSRSSLPTCTGGEPPACCTPHNPAEWERRGELLAAARERSRAMHPQSCPACASEQIAPLFPGPEYDCQDCGHVWEVGR